MKVILINGSPRKKGCTYTSLSIVAQELEKNGIETEIIQASEKEVKHCTGCGYCQRVPKGYCVFKDDHVNETSDKVAAADGVILGSPVYFSSMTSLASAFFCRLFRPSYRLLPDKLRHKVGAAVVCLRRSGGSVTYQQIMQYFDMCEMPTVTSMYWPIIHGNRPEDIMQDEEGLQTLRILGSNMAWMLKNIEAGKKAGNAVPPYEEKLRTNFIRSDLDYHMATEGLK